MLKQVERSIRNKIGFPTKTVFISFDEGDVNYADLTIKTAHVNAAYAAFKLEMFGTFNYFNNCGYAEFATSRLNSYAKTECIHNGMPSKDIFVGLIKVVDRRTCKIRIWVTNKHNNIDYNSKKYRTRITEFSDGNRLSEYPEDEYEDFEISIEYGKEEPVIPLVPMITGDYQVASITNDETMLGTPYYVLNDDIHKVCFPVANPQYKVMTRYDKFGYTIMTDSMLEQHAYVDGLSAGEHTINWHIPFQTPLGYTVQMTPINGGPSLVQLCMVGAESYKAESVGVNLSNSCSIDVYAWGPYKPDRFKDPQVIYATKVASDDKKKPRIK